MWQELKVSAGSDDSGGFEYEGMEVANKNCTVCKECGSCGWKSFERNDCEKCYNCKANKNSPDEFTRLECGNCELCDASVKCGFTPKSHSIEGRIYPRKECDTAIYSDCFTCKYCYNCFRGTDNDSPPGLKGHTMIQSKAGVVLYGGITWNTVNMDVADSIGK